MKLDQYDKSVLKIVGFVLVAVFLFVAAIAAIVNYGDSLSFLSRPLGEQKTWAVLLAIWLVCSMAR